MPSKRVAIITRTKDRPIMLPRVRESIRAQTFRDFIWVIVNDAGQKSYVDTEAAKAEDAGIEVRVVHREKSIGMEAASNDGIEQSESEFLVIHDDDDSWEANFLDATVGFLDENDDVVAVATQSTKVIEEIQGQNIRIRSREPYNSWMQALLIADVIQHNPIPPISLLFRRSAYDRVGGFDETLPVLGDWDFHLRLLLIGEIGVITKPLANYHHRPKVNADKSVYGNTVTSGVDKHVQFEAIYRNRKLREDLANNQIGLGFLLTFGRLHNRVEFHLERKRLIEMYLVKLMDRLGIKGFMKRIARL